VLKQNVCRQIDQGFTLMEILVVLVIIGITVGLVRLNAMPDDAETLKMEANRFGLLAEQAANEARASGRTHALVITETGYIFQLKNDEGEWKPTTDDILRTREWPEGMIVSNIEIDGQKAVKGQKILFSSSGYNSVFVIHFLLNEERITVSGTTTGRVSVQ
jgi:general secretion pathway protein H